jgi:hypothetical protein
MIPAAVSVQQQHSATLFFPDPMGSIFIPGSGSLCGTHLAGIHDPGHTMIADM